MSHLMESMVNRGLTQNGSEVVPNQPPQQSLDFVKVLWRWKWLPILGALIGAGVGYMFYTKIPEQFQSFALVQVGYALPATSNIELYDPDKVIPWGNPTDEARVIRSQKVLSLAVKLGDLVKYFPEHTETQVIVELMEEDSGVMVVPAERSDRVQTDQLIISYISGNPEASQAVVSAVVAGYQAFLSEQYRNVDEEMVAYFTQSEKNLSEQIQRLNKEIEDFRKNSPKDIIWTPDEVIDPYLESWKQNSAALDELSREKMRLQTKLDAVNAAKQNGRGPEDILLLLSDGNDIALQPIIRELFSESGFSGSDRLSDKLEAMELTALKAQKDEMLATLGANHPTIKNIQSLINVTEQKIVAMREKETLALQQVEQARNRARPNDPNAGNGVVPATTDLATNGADGNAENNDGESDATANAVESMSPDAMKLWIEIGINALTDRHQQVGKQLAYLQEITAEQLRQSRELQEVFFRNKQMQKNLESIEQLYNSISEKVKAVELIPSNSNPNHKVLRELNAASLGSKYGPFAPRYVLGGATLGILLMSGLAILMDLADRSYRSPDEIVSDLGRPVLGHVPAMDLPNIKKVVNSVDASIITLHHSRGRIAEAFRSVRTGLFFSSRGCELKVVQITSPVPGDGKSTVSSNLAVTMAQSGRRVLLIDADFRRPRLHKLFGLEVQAGLAQLVAGECELDDAAYSTCIANLTMMPGGKRPNNPAELLASNRFGELVELLREKYDIIIIDTPPLLAVSDPSVVASLVDGVVLTMRLRRNVKPLATRAFRVLESVDAQILGVVVNGVSTEAAYGGYGYNYSYNDYRYSYRSNYNYGYGYRKYNTYSEYSAGYIEDKQTDEVVEADASTDANPQS